MWAMGVITFILLAGYPPFHDDGDQRKLFDRIRRAEYSFDEEYWGSITKQAKDLIKGLLTIDPAKRLTADQALTHPWVGLTADDLSRINLVPKFIELNKLNPNRNFMAAAKALIAIKNFNNFIVNGSEKSATPHTPGTPHAPAGMTANPAAQSR
jgi:serine/threonine protein kinase